jgi:hypothetical protein
MPIPAGHLELVIGVGVDLLVGRTRPHSNWSEVGKILNM